VQRFDLGLRCRLRGFGRVGHQLITSWICDSSSHILAASRRYIQTKNRRRHFEDGYWIVFPGLFRKSQLDPIVGGRGGRKILRKLHKLNALCGAIDAEKCIFWRLFVRLDASDLANSGPHAGPVHFIVPELKVIPGKCGGRDRFSTR
jgi:hypothetical protein